MRAFRKSWIGIGLAILFAASLFFFRGSERYSNLFNSDNFVAHISGTPISTTKFMREMNYLVSDLSQQIGGKLSYDDIIGYGVYNKALNNLVSRAIFENEFDKINFILDDTTVAKSTKTNLPYLYENNRLNDDALNSFLRQEGLKIEDLVDLVDFQTRALVFDELFFYKEYPNQLSLNIEKHNNQIREIDFLEIPYENIILQNFKKEEITKSNSEILEFFNNNIKNYMTNEERDISYILLEKSDFENNFLPTDIKIKDYFENNLALFLNPEKRSFKQFNFKSTVEAENFKINISGKSNDEILKYSEENNILFSNFEKVDKNKVLDQLADVIFNLNKGSVSDVVETTLASHIIILDEIYPEKVKDFADVKNDIITTLTNFELDNFFDELKLDLNQQILDGFSINEIADQNNLVITDKNRISNTTQTEDQILNNIISFSFIQNKDFVSDVIDLNKDISFIVNVKNIYPSETEKIDEVFQTVLNDFIFSKKTKQAQNIFEDNIENFTNISDLYGFKEQKITLSFNDENEIPFSLKQRIFNTKINETGFGSDKNKVYYYKIKKINFPSDIDSTLDINLLGDLKIAFGNEIGKTKKRDFNDELINGLLLSQYK